MRARSILSGLLTCGVLSACGGMDGTTPSAPGAPALPTPASPTPAPSPVITSAGYLHVLQSPWVMTYEIDPTGRLRPPVTQDIARDWIALAGEPQGRFVYARHGGWSLNGNGTGGGSDLTVSTYASDPRHGTLAELSYATVAHPPAETCSYCADRGLWVWLKGGANRVHGLWQKSWGTVGRHTTYTYVSIPVAGDGQLGPVSEHSFPFDSDPGQVIVDVRSDVLYKAGVQPWAPSGTNARGGLEAHVIEPDGTLTRMGWTNLCLGSTMCEYCVPSPLVTARGFLFASVFTVLQGKAFETVCSYQGLRLKPLDAFDLSTFGAEAFVPSSEAEPVLLPMSVPISTAGVTRWELRVYAMNGEGDLQPVSSEELSNPITRLLFHPSGRFLYAVDTALRLRAYAVDASGRVDLTMSIDQAGGSMAITLKDAQAEDF